MKKVLIKAFGDGDFSAQETIIYSKDWHRKLLQGAINRSVHIYQHGILDTFGLLARHMHAFAG